MTTLPQSGRAGLQLMGSLQRFSSTKLHERAKEDFYADPEMVSFSEQPLGPRDPAELDAIVEKATSVANKHQAHRLNRLYQRLVAEAIYDRGIPAAEERRGTVNEPAANPEEAHENVGTLTLNDDLETPDYADGVEWHLMPGGWDGYDQWMLMFRSGVMPHIFRHGGYAAVDIDADIYGQRMSVLNQLPEKEYKRIYEAGCGGTPTMAILRKKFPDAELTGADLSGHMLKGGHTMDRLTGLNVHLKQEDCRHTSEPDNHYDAVVAYAVFHETPDDACIDILKEMHRILAPGGHMLISDPGPLRALTPYQAVLYDWEQDNREEPHFGASIRRNLPALMREVGFSDAKEYGIGPGNYPWVTLGQK